MPRWVYVVVLDMNLRKVLIVALGLMLVAEVALRIY